MSSYKELTNSPAYNFVGENKWDIKTPSDNWSVFDGSILTQNDNNKLFEKIGYVYDFPEGQFFTSNSTVTGTSDNINAFLYANNTYVFAGNGGVLATSEDTSIWTIRTSGTSDNINQLAYGNNTFAYVANNGTVATSPDAVTWTPRTSGTFNDINALIYANNTFVYAGGSGVLATSSNAVTWTVRTSGTSNNINTLVYGNNTFVYVGDNGVIGTSSNASTWSTSQLSPIIYAGGRTFSRTGDTDTTALALTSLSGGTDTAPKEGDIVVIAVSTAATSNTFLAVTGYTQIASLFAEDTYDTNLWVGYKIMGATPDTSVTIPACASSADAQTAAIQVWRNATFDSATTVTASNTVLVNPPAITTTSNNNMLLVIGAGAHDRVTATYAASYLSNFQTFGQADTNDSTIGFGSIARPTSGTYDPAQWNFSDASGPSYSYASVTVALTPQYRNNKALTFANNTFVVGGSSGFLATSSDATSWTVRSSNTAAEITGLTYGAGYFMYGANGTLAKSTDAINWTNQGNETTQYVGSSTAIGFNTETVVSLTGLTGGIASLPRAGDIVVVAVATGSTASRSQAVTGYTQIDALYSNDNYDTNLFVGYKVMGATPDTTVTIPASGADGDAQRVSIQVWRNVSFDSATTVTTINTVLANPPAITTSTDNNVLLIFGAGGRAGNDGLYAASYLSDFRTGVGSDNTNDVIIGSGYVYQSTAGTYDPAAFTASGFTDSALYSSAAVTVALKIQAPKTGLTFINSGYYYGGNLGEYSIYSFTSYNPAIEFKLPDLTPLQIINDYSNDVYVKL